MDQLNSAPLECCFCGEIETGVFPQALRSAYPIESRIFSSTSDDFVVMPSVSPMCTGHVLVLPRNHITRMADLPKERHVALVACIDATVTGLRSRTGGPYYFFEHGVTSGKMACGVDHAHLHILPLPLATLNSIERRVDETYAPRAHGSLREVLAKAAKSPGSYLLHGIGLDRIKVSFDEQVPSQFMRRTIAKVQGATDWDWNGLFGWHEFRATHGTLARP
jgi:diadenosine tetraphosphate (Ap4A) HIT family hydrolase